MTQWILDRPATQPKTEPVAAPKQSPQQPNWLVIALACAVAFFVVRELREGGVIPSPTPDDSVVVDVTGDWALVLVDDDRQDQLSAGQKAAINWSGVKPLADSKGIEYRRLDVKDDFEKVEREFQAMESKAADPPSLTIVSDGNLTTGPVPEGIDAFKAKIEGVK